MPSVLSQQLPTKGLYCAAQKAQNGFIHRFFENIEALENHITMQDKAGHTMYVAQASYKTSESRKTENAQYVRSFIFDVDCGEEKFAETPDKAYPTQRDGATAIKAFAEVIGLPLPTVTNSGNGLYCHWMMEEDIEADKWKVLATILKKVAQAAGFRQDPSRTSDTTSVLRPAGSTNRKGEPKPVTIIHLSQPLPLKTFTDALNLAAAKFKVNADHLQLPTQFKGLNDEFTAGVEGPPSSLLLVANKCAQVRRVRDTLGNVDEPTWYNFLGMARYTAEGKEVVILHEWSKGHPDYTPEGTKAKIDQHVRAGFGPTTCDKFAADSPALCIACPHANSIKSPIVLGRPEPEAIGTEEEKKVSPEGFRRAEDGLFYEDDGVWHRFYPSDLYVANLAYDPSLGYEVATVAHKMPHNEDYSYFLLRSSLVHDPKLLLMTLADCHVQTSGVESRKKMITYIDLAMTQIRASRKLAALHSQMGWKDLEGTNAFILGENLYQRDLEPESVGYAKNVPEAARAFRAQGDFETWKKTTALLGMKGMEPFAFAFLAGAFGAPLIRFTGFAGAMVALIGDSGIGKTLLGEWLMSVYGDSQKLILLKDDTKNFLVQRLGLYGSLPLYIDEVSNIEGQELSDLVYKITQGRDKGRLGRNGIERNIINSWNTIAVATSNHSLTDKLGALKSDASAEINRILEIDATAVRGFGREEATAAYHSFRENFGLAGPHFIKYITDHQDQHRDKIDKIVRALDLDTDAQSEERFWSNVAGTAIYGGLIASHLGIIDFAITPILEWVKKHIRSMRQVKQENVVVYSDLLGMFLDAHLRGTLFCEGNGAKEIVRPIKEPTAALVARINIDTKRLYISRSALKQYLEKTYGNYTKLRREMEKIGALLDHDKRKVLGGGTYFSGTQQPVWEIDLNVPALGWKTLGIVRRVEEEAREGAKG